MSEKVNFGNVAEEYAKYRDEIPSIIFDQLEERNMQLNGQKVIDLGSGTGIFSRSMAKRGAHVMGVEPAESLIFEAKKADKSLGLDIDYIHSAAEDVDLPSESYDVITALRSWHWFNRNIVNQKVLHSLKKDGVLIVIHAIFVPRISKVAQETISIIKEHIAELKPAGAMAGVKERRTGLPINWFNEWTKAGFVIVDEWEYDYQLEFTISEWCGKVRSLSWLTNETKEVKENIITKLQDSLVDYPSPLEIPHQYSVVLLKKK